MKMTLKDKVLNGFISIIIIIIILATIIISYIQTTTTRKNESPSYSIEIKERNRIK